MKFSLKKYNYLYCLEFFNNECFSHIYRLTHASFYFIQIPDIYPHIYLHFTPNKDFDSSCFKILNWHYLKHINDKEKLKAKKKELIVHIRTYIRRLERFLQQRFKVDYIILGKKDI